MPIQTPKQLVVVRNVTFGTGSDIATSYAEVYVVNNRVVGEMLFKGKLTDCWSFVDNGDYEATAAPTTPFMPINRADANPRIK